MPMHRATSCHARRVLAAAGFALAATAPVSHADDRGLKDPGPDVHIWLGTGTSNWQNNANWNVGFPPGFDDTAIVNGGMTDVVLSSSTPQIRSLFLAGGITLYTDGHLLDVTSGVGTATTAGASTTLNVAGVLAGGSPGFISNTLTVDSESRLRLVNGRVRINDRFILGTDATIYGHGLLEIHSNNPAAFSGVNGAAIRVDSGELSVVVSGGGQMALPELLEFTQPRGAMTIDAPLINSVRDVSMRENASLLITHPWTLSGDLVADGAGIEIGTDLSNQVTVSASGTVSVTSGDLTVMPPANFAAGSHVSVSPNASLTIAGNGSDAQAGSSFDIASGGSLRIESTQPIGDFWSGDIELNVATLEIAHPGYFRVNGDITLLSLFGLRSRIEGPGTLHLTGDLIVPGGGGIIANTLELGPGGSIELGNASTVLRVEGELVHNVATSIIGTGTVQIDAGGSYTYAQPASLLADINNAAGTVAIEGAFDAVASAVWSVDYRQGNAGALHVKLAGLNPGQFDRIATSGSATLAGSVEVELLNAYEPEIGDTFEILEASAGITGGFAQTVGAAGFEVETMGNIVLLTYVGVPDCVADFTGDGVLNFFDVSAFLNAYNTGNHAADLTHDGAFNFFDVSAFLGAYTQGCP